MNKTVLRVLSAVMALMMVISLVACGGDSKSGSSSESSSGSSSSSSSESSAEATPEPAPESTPDSSESSESSSAAGTYATVTEFLEDNRDTISAAIEQTVGGQDKMEISLDSADDSLIYKFIFTDSAMEGIDEEALTAALEEQINADPNRFYALEGYLFPDTYEFYVIDDMKKNPDFDTEQYAKSAAEKMFGNFEDKLTRSML